MPKAAVPTSARIKAATLSLPETSCMRTAASTGRASVRPARAAAMCACILLAACGKPVKERQLDAAACGTYLSKVDYAGNTRNVEAAPFLAALQKAVVAKSPGWDKMRDLATKMPFVIRQADELSAKSDFQVFAEAGAKGIATYTRHMEAVDGPAAVAYLAGCVENYDALRAP